MSSLLKTRGSPQQGLTRFLSIHSPSYVSNSVYGGAPLLFPFIYSNSVLDLNLQDDSQSLIAAGTFDSGLTYRFPIRLMGGCGSVRSIGANFEAYLRNCIRNINNLSYNYTNELTVTVPAVVTKIQSSMPSPTGTAPLLYPRTMHDSGIVPSSDSHIYAGGDSDNWKTYWVFKTPLTIRYLIGATYKYLTFTTRFEYV